MNLNAELQKPKPEGGWGCGLGKQPRGVSPALPEGQKGSRAGPGRELGRLCQEQCSWHVC